VRGDWAARHHDAVDLAVLDLIDPELQKTIIYEDPMARLDVLNYLLVGVESRLASPGSPPTL
jgi:hypothetical protein